LKPSADDLPPSPGQAQPEERHETTRHWPFPPRWLATVLAFAGPVEDREALMKERGQTDRPAVQDRERRDAVRRRRALLCWNRLQVNADKTVADIDVLWAPTPRRRIPASPEGFAEDLGRHGGLQGGR
jgi:hypothetical protein